LTVNVRGYAKATVPEHTFALLLALSRSIVPYRQEVLDGGWQAAGQFCFFTNPIIDLAGKRIGIVGAGVLGSQVAAIARGFGMDVVFYDPMAKAETTGVVSFNELVASSDVITLHCPLTSETRGMFDLAVFR